MVRAQRYLEIIEEENLVEHARVAGEHLLRRLNDLHEEFPRVVSNVRGRGLFCAFDLRGAEERNSVRKLAYEKGLVILGSGERSLRFRPALNISKGELDEGIGILRESISRLS